MDKAETLLRVQELEAFAAPRRVMRIPPENDVPLTERVVRLVDTSVMRRLARVSQMGLVALVYPGAVHSRLEHSLGVYQRGLQFVRRLCHEPQFVTSATPRAVEAFIVATLLHDCGHWPYCHPVEDMQLEEIPRHEELARRLISGSEVAELLDGDWLCDVDDVMRLLTNRPDNAAESILCSVLSGPIDVDKLDYLQRDSTHAGVPYGRNFDAGRIAAAVCVHPERPQMAISEKGRTAAEMMVFARYVMFSEVYWHHAVRSATAMLQRAVWLLRPRIELTTLFDKDDAGWVDAVRRAADGSLAERLVQGLFGPRRQLYKRAAEFDALSGAALHKRLARRGYPWLVRLSEELAEQLSEPAGRQLSSADVLIDAPPVKLEVDINIDVIGRDASPRRLGQVSPVVSALANQQFDDYVKRVRIFLPDEVCRRLPGGRLDPQRLMQAIQRVESRS